MTPLSEAIATALRLITKKNPKNLMAQPRSLFHGAIKNVLSQTIGQGNSFVTPTRWMFGEWINSLKQVDTLLLCQYGQTGFQGQCLST